MNLSLTSLTNTGHIEVNSTIQIKHVRRVVFSSQLIQQNTSSISTQHWSFEEFDITFRCCYLSVVTWAWWLDAQLKRSLLTVLHFVVFPFEFSLSCVSVNWFLMRGAMCGKKWLYAMEGGVTSVSSYRWGVRVAQQTTQLSLSTHVRECERERKKRERGRGGRER